MTRNVLRAAVPAIAAAFTAGCLGPDVEKPPMPRVDAVRSPTGRPTQIVRGSAEYGATLEVTREPAFSEAEKPAGPITADPFTARWEVEVPLKDGENTFTFTAIDAANNHSDPRQAKITRSAPLPVAVRIQVNSPIVSASIGELRAFARIELSEEGVPLDGFTVLFNVSEYTGGTIAQVSATTDTQGIARATLTGLRGVGGGKVTAASGDDPDIGDATDFVVIGGPASALSLKLKAAGSTDTPSQAVTVAAGTDVEMTVSVKDGSDNVLQTSFNVVTEAPGAFAQGNKLKNLTAAGGPYRVVATVTGTATVSGQVVSDVATVTVNPAAATTLEVVPPAQGATAGVPFALQVRARDVYGNALANATITGASSTGAKADPQFAFNTTSKTATFKTAGARSLTVDATAGTANVSGTTEVQVAAAEPATITLQLTGTDRDTNTTVLDVKPDDTITLASTVRDAFGNDVQALIDVKTDPPLLVGGWRIDQPGKAGSYKAIASVLGAPGVVPAVVAFNVIAGDPASATFALAASTAAAGTRVAVTAGVFDAFGNRTAHTVLPNATTGGFTNHGNTAISFTTASTTAYEVSASVLNFPALVVCDSNTSTPAPLCPTLLVSAGAPTTLMLAVPNQPLNATSTTPFDITLTLTDAFSNAVSAPVEITIVPKQPMDNAPTVTVSGGKIYGLNRAGTYVATGRVFGTTVESLAIDVVVNAGATSTADLALGAQSTWQGAPIPYKVKAWDSAGNPLTPSTVNFEVKNSANTTLTAGTGYTTDPSVITILAGADVYRVTACLGDCAVGATIKDAELVTILEPPDTEAPTIAITSPGDPASVQNGQPIPVTVTATDNRYVAQVYVSAEGALNTSATQVPTFPTTSFTYSFASVGAVMPDSGDVRIRAAAVDGAGNVSYTTFITVCSSHTDMSNYTVNNTDFPALKCTLARGSAIDESYGVARDAAGNVYLASRARNAVVKVDTNSAAADFVLQAKFPNSVATPQGVTVFGNTSLNRLFISAKAGTANANAVFKAELPATDLGSAFFSGTAGAGASDRVYQLFANTTQLFAADASSSTVANHRIIRMDPTASSGTTTVAFTPPTNYKARGVCADGTNLYGTFLDSSNAAKIATAANGSAATMTALNPTSFPAATAVGDCAMSTTAGSIIVAVGAKLVKCTTSGSPACVEIVDAGSRIMSGVLVVDSKTLLFTDPANDLLVKLVITNPAKAF